MSDAQMCGIMCVREGGGGEEGGRGKEGGRGREGGKGGGKTGGRDGGGHVFLCMFLEQ